VSAGLNADIVRNEYRRKYEYIELDINKIDAKTVDEL